MNYVYKIQNTENGKCYIGITSRTVDERWKDHLSRVACYERNNRLYFAIRKYGIEKFEVETIGQSESDDIIRSLESKYIREYDSYNNGYNCNYGGHGNLTMSDETRKKISESQKGKVISLETRKKMSQAKLGKSECADNFKLYVNDHHLPIKLIILLSYRQSVMVIFAYT